MKSITEQTLADDVCSVFSRVLGLKPTDIDDEQSFFERGGTSLTAAQAIALLQRDVSSAITVECFFTGPSISQLVRGILTE